jgi:hypothetical protein
LEELIDTNELQEDWFYIIIQDPSSETEQFIGFSDSQTQEKFIPLFKTKDHAKKCFALMPKDLFNGNYAVQAVIKEDLLFVAKENGHRLYLLDEKGTILDEIND